MTLNKSGDTSTSNRAASPSGSFYAMSDDSEGEYNTIRSQRTGRGVKLLYSKSKVYVHPSASAKDNIPGFIALIQQKSSPKPSASSPATASTSTKSDIDPKNLLLAWVPESSLGDAYDAYVKVDQAEGDSPPKQTYLVPPLPTNTPTSSSLGSYAFALPLNSIYSLSVRPPSVGWWFGSLVINTRSGESLPALFFHDSECQSTINQRKKLARENFDPFGEGGNVFWGGDEVLRWLKRYIDVHRSAEANVFLVEPSEEDKRAFASSPRASSERANADRVKKALEGDKNKSEPWDSGMDPVTKVLKEARWNILEKLSQVTTFTRRTAQAAAENKNLPPQLRRLMQNPDVQTVQDEFDSARLYLARWAMGIAEQSEKERNQRIWTASDVLKSEDSEVGEFEILELDMNNLSMGNKRKPVTKKEWDGFFNSTNGRLQVTVDEVKERIFHGGLDPEDGVRKEAWLFLLGVYEWDSSSQERQAKINSLRDEYIRLKGAWWERMMDGEGTLEEREWWKDQKLRIEKDVHRTDRHMPLFEGEDIPHPDPTSPFAEIGTNVHMEQMKDMLLTYNEYNRQLGYVQGMSDLLAPIYAVMQDDAVAFWGFAGFMDRMERNFLRDQSGMRLQLTTLDQLVQLIDPKLYLHLQSVDSTNFFFFFRMLLVWYKREFEWDNVLRLWEGLWTDYLSANFHLFIALAILEKHRDVIMEHLRGFDEVLKYVNELSNTIDLESTLIRAEALFRRFQRVVEAVDKKKNFPDVPQRRTSAGPSSPPPTTAPSPSQNKGKQSIGSHIARIAGVEDTKEKIVTPELRDLLSREVKKLDKHEIKEHGGGVGNPA
ncbi:rab-GTPase-TBC domain-containing protein [Elsinoe ampelina]|uniref:GTPase-activating protein GYP7 n=1 Tax=Elsinoe ampelina TaxID=302913 RepID=A0A6A6FZ47_9PEZI|nr:rab-GTPase-TBC domain-containing protein [Elsinoe ampelina]